MHIMTFTAALGPLYWYS